MTWGMQPLVRDDYTAGVEMRLVDYPDDLELTAGPAPTSGILQVSSDPVDLGFIWRVERLTTVVSATVGGSPIATPAGSAFWVYKGVPSLAAGSTPAPIKFRDGSSAPGLDVADEFNPITVQQGLPLLFYWTGLAPGTYAAVSVQYSLYRRMITGTG